MPREAAELLDAGIGLALVLAGAIVNKNPAINGLFRAALFFAVLFFGYALWKYL